MIEGPHEHWNRLLQARFRRSIPDVADRVVFLPHLTPEVFFGLLEAADVVLDPSHFGGGNSTYEALSLGVPIVTCPGPFMRSRVTAGCYRQMGVMDTVAASTDEYVEIAVRLANDPAWRDEVKGKILANNHQLFEDAEAVREIERFLERPSPPTPPARSKSKS